MPQVVFGGNLVRGQGKWSPQRDRPAIETGGLYAMGKLGPSHGAGMMF